jgi:radical SAM superfamily enzyme YgiQ (UPF0313 family)
MKVILLNPNSGYLERIENEAAWPPLGMLYIGTILQNAGHEVKVIDNARIQLPIDGLVKRIKKENPGIIGMSILTHTFRHGIKIASAIKSEIPDVKIVFGNYHATFVYDKLLRKYPVVDYVVLGEGEHTFLELVNVLEKGRNIKGVKGVAFRHNGSVVKTKPRPFIQNLDDLPFPDRTLLEQKYHSELVGLIGSSGKFTTILTSRGCPYECRYCSCSAFSLRKIRLRSPEAVVAEMQQLQEEGYEEVGFVDDNLLMNRHRIEKICDLLKKNKIKLTLWAEGRVDHASYGVLKRFAKAGCKIMYFGIESGNQKVLDYYGKNISPDMSRKAVVNSKKAGIENVIGSFIVGAPMETRKDIRQTFDFIISLKGMDFPQINILSLSPGMELWDEAIKKGYLNEDKCWEIEIPAISVYPSVLSAPEIFKMINNFYIKFVKRPDFIFLQLLKTIKSKHRLKIIMANLRAGTNFMATLNCLQNSTVHILQSSEEIL